MQKINLKLLAMFSLLIVSFTSCLRENEEPIISNSADNANQTSTEKKMNSNEIPTAWMDLTLKLIKTTPGYTPPVASRTFGYMGVALYEATVNGSVVNKSIATQLNINPVPPAPQPNKYYYWNICANASMAQAARKFFVTTSAANKVTIDSLENYFNAQALANFNTVIVNNSITYGRNVADAIYNWSATDAVGHEGYLKNVDPNYVPPTGPGKWIPTPPLFAPAVQPHWGDVRPFVAQNPNIWMPNPLTYSLSPQSNYYKQALEVYNTKTNLTAAQTTIALYWADGGGTLTPPGHCLNIATQVIRKEGSDLYKTAEVYSRVGMAVADAFIQCWKEKYIHNAMRPITYINYNIDPAWTPLIDTPPFPEYSSGHSSQSGASSQVLSSIYGFNYSFTDYTKVPDGFAPRTFNSFYAFAEEAAVSRLYGGIHFRAANENGVICGRKIGSNIMKIVYKK
jgi:hypothetical protein